MTTLPSSVTGWVALSLMVSCTTLPTAPGDFQHDSTIVLIWTRDGGFVGFCDELKVSAAGDVTVASCRTPGRKRRTLEAGDLARLNDWRKGFGTVNITSGDAPVYDAMQLKLTLSGNGRVQPTAAQRQELLEWAERVYSETK